MSILSAICEGDFTIAAGSDSQEYGYGDISVNRNCVIHGTTASTGVSTGAIICHGGVGVLGDVYIGGNTNLGVTRVNGDMQLVGDFGVIAGTVDVVASGGTASFSSFDNTCTIYSGYNSSNAVQIRAVHPSGGVDIQSGNVAGGVSISSAAGGIALFCSQGNANITSSDGDVYVTGADVHLRASTGSVKIHGDCDIIGGITNFTGASAVNVASSHVNVFGGLGVVSDTMSNVDISTYGAQSYFQNIAMFDGNDLNILIEGTTNSKINISSSCPSADTISLVASTGGALIQSNLALRLDSNNEIRIGRSVPGTHVSIGTPNSTTTIYGELNVIGSVSTVESTVVTVADNVILLNSGPSGISDGGVVIQRYQIPNDSGSGQIVNNGAPAASGFVSNAFNDYSHFTMDSSLAQEDGYYTGYWVRVYTGTGALQVRQISAYDSATNVATVSTDFGTILDSTSGIYLFNSNYEMMIWDESRGEFACASATKSPVDVPLEMNAYSNLHVATLTCDNMITTRSNGLTADYVINVTINNTNTSPVDIPLLKTYGVYTLHIQCEASDGAYAIFFIARTNVDGYPGTVARPTSARGRLNEQLMVTWPAGSYPQLQYRPAPTAGTGFSVYMIRVTSV